MSKHSWFTSLYSRNSGIIVKQLYPNPKIIMTTWDCWADGRSPLCIQSMECGAWGSEGPCELPPPFRSKCRLARGCHRQCWDPKGCEKIVSVSWEVASDILCLRASNQGSLCPHALTPETYSLSLLLLDSYTHYFKQQFTPPLLYLGVSLVAQAVKNLPAIQET